MAKIVTTFYLEPAQHQELKTVSHTTGIPMARIAREAFDLWLLARKRGKRTTVKDFGSTGNKE